MDAGASFVTKNSTGITALHAAAVSGNWPTIEVLLRAGSDPFIASSSGKSAIEEAAVSDTSQNAGKMIEWICKEASGTTPFQAILRQWSPSLFDLWMQHVPADYQRYASYTTEKGTPLLFLLAYMGSMTGVQKLVEIQPDWAEKCDAKGRRVLDLWLEPEIGEFLESKLPPKKETAEDSANGSTEEAKPAQPNGNKTDPEEQSMPATAMDLSASEETPSSTPKTRCQNCKKREIFCWKLSSQCESYTDRTQPEFFYRTQAPLCCTHELTACLHRLLRSVLYGL
jgi:hypothetical protein